jgi:hypothetical protein
MQNGDSMKGHLGKPPVLPILKRGQRNFPKSRAPRGAGQPPISSPHFAQLAPDRRHSSVGMDSDVWNPNYPYSYPLKMLIWISVFVFVFNMDVRWMYSNPIFNIIRNIRQKSYISDIIRIRKNKVLIGNI